MHLTGPKNPKFQRWIFSTTTWRVIFTEFTWKAMRSLVWPCFFDLWSQAATTSVGEFHYMWETSSELGPFIALILQKSLQNIYHHSSLHFFAPGHHNQICVPAASWGELCLQNRWFFFPNKNQGLLVHRDLKHLGLDDGWELGWFSALAWSPWPEDQIRRLSRSSKNNNRHGYYRTCLRSIAPLMEERPYNIPSTQIYINDAAHQ